MSEHTIKCWPQYFEAIARGEKNFEVRRDDRGYQKGDVLILQKYNPISDLGGGGYVYNGQGHVEIRRRITYILTGGQLGIASGYVVMALGPDAAE